MPSIFGIRRSSSRIDGSGYSPAATPKRLHYTFRRSRVAAPKDARTSPNSRVGSLLPLVLTLDSGWLALSTVQTRGTAIRCESFLGLSNNRVRRREPSGAFRLRELAAAIVPLRSACQGIARTAAPRYPRPYRFCAPP